MQKKGVEKQSNLMKKSSLFGNFIKEEIRTQGLFNLKSVLGKSLAEVVQREILQLQFIADDKEVWSFIKTEIGIHERVVDLAMKIQRNLRLCSYNENCC